MLTLSIYAHPIADHGVINSRTSETFQSFSKYLMHIAELLNQMPCEKAPVPNMQSNHFHANGANSAKLSLELATVRKGATQLETT